MFALPAGLTAIEAAAAAGTATSSQSENKPLTQKNFHAGGGGE